MYFDKLDLNLWKSVQDKFAKEIGLAISTVDREGKEVLLSGKEDFLTELIKSKREDIFKERNYNQLNELEQDETALHNCFGAVHIIKPVILHDRIIGAIICGPVRKEEYDYNVLADKLGIEEDELADAANGIKELSKEDIKFNRKIVSLMAEILPKLSYQKQTKDKQISELKALYSIIKMVNSTLELEEVLQKMMEFLVNTLNAADCSVFVETEDGEKKYCLKKEIENLIEIEKAVSKKAIEEKQIITVKDINGRFGTQVIEDYNSMLSIPLKHRDKIIGSINLYGKNLGGISEEGLNFISVMANQVAIAIANAQRYGEVKELAVVDKLTGAFNRRYFMELLEKEMEKGVGIKNPIALVLLDIDNFGKYNNAHGHPMGDKLLKELSGIVKFNMRMEDKLGRYGGEEFIVMLPGLKSNEAMAAAKRIKETISEHKFEGGKLSQTEK